MCENICVICSADNASYKCPSCRKRYCSAPCCKSHKISCINITRRINENRKLEDEISRDLFQEERPLDETKIIDDEISFALFQEARRNLSSSKFTLNVLKSKRLRSTISAIDSAPDRQVALKKARRNKDFDEFISKMLMEARVPKA